MLQNNTYPTLKPYAVDLLIKWHRDDPVSEKEINRNNEVYRVQGNRNPFVDFPELAEHIWGNLKNTVWRDTDKFYIIYDKKTKKLSASLNNPENGEGNVEIRILNEKFSSNSTVDVIIYNVAGMKILSEKLNSDSTIDLSQLPKGIYVILAYGDSIRGAEKFLVQ